jgi:hypothetical protein
MRRRWSQNYTNRAIEEQTVNSKQSQQMPHLCTPNRTIIGSRLISQLGTTTGVPTSLVAALNLAQSNKSKRNNNNVILARSISPSDMLQSNDLEEQVIFDIFI